MMFDFLYLRHPMLMLLWVFARMVTFIGFSGRPKSTADIFRIDDFRFLPYCFEDNSIIFLLNHILKFIFVNQVHTEVSTINFD